MRRLPIFLAVLAVVLVSLWAVGETLLAREARRMLQDQPEVQATSIRPLRNPARFGLGFDDLRIAAPQGDIVLPQVALALRSLQPNELSLDLPERGQIGVAGRMLDIGLTAPLARLRVAPLNQLTISRAEIAARQVTLDGAALSGPLSIRADLTAMGSDSPQAAMIAYDVDVAVAGLDLTAWPDVPPSLAGPLSLEGKGLVWLDALTSPQSLSSGVMPGLAGLRMAESRVAFGNLHGSVAADLRADAQGRMDGQIVIYTREAEPMLSHAVTAGYLSEAQKTFVLGMLSQISRNTANGDAGSSLAAIDSSDPEAAQELARRRPDFRAPVAGELRLPIRFADGMMRLGSVDLGPAPLWPGGR